MTRKFITYFLLLSLVVFGAACNKDKGSSALSEDNLYNAAGNESFKENQLVDATATRLWTTPEFPNADESVTISFRAGKTSALYGYTGDVYAHIGILEYGTWKFVQAEWTENKDKCKFTKDSSAVNTWHQRKDSGYTDRNCN